MKRHAALVELSHDHHAALFVALQLRRADESTADKAHAVFMAYWDTHGQQHFREEEEVLFPAWATFGSAHHPMVAQALCDHVAIRGLAQQLAGQPSNVAVLGELGVELERHVRFEERSLFPLIESEMPDEALVRLGQALADRARSSG